MGIITILKLIGAGTLALLGGLLGLKVRKRTDEKKVQNLENEVNAAVSKEQAAIKQTQEIVKKAGENQQAHEQSVKNVEAYAEARNRIEDIEEEADEKTADIINADIAAKLKFMRNQTADTD
jgi:esterase/lipase